MSVQISSEFPFMHQIAFTSRPGVYNLSKNSLKIKAQFGEDNYRLWSLEAANNFLRDFYPTSVVSAFDTLTPYAFKSDLVRYCLVNTFGGTYSDLSICRLKTFSAQGHDMVIFRDGNSNRTSWKVNNSLFYSKPNNPILIDAIEQIVSNVGNRYYGHDPHFNTGPSVFGRATAKFGNDMDLLVGQYLWLKHRKNKFVLPGNNVVARGKRGGAFKGGVSGVIGGNNYNEIWAKRAVYGEINDDIR
jgi:hypothetical protein